MLKNRKYPEYCGSNNANWKGGKSRRICEICGAEFFAYLDKNHKGRFCSNECRFKSVIPTNKIHRICGYCNKSFYVPKCRTLNNRGKFCSRMCSSAYTMKYLIKRKDTDIERIVENFLKQTEIFYEKQKVISGITIVDFFLPPNICLFADGEYWHNRSKRIEADNRINEKLKSLGYDVYRLKGETIKHSLSNFERLLL